MIFNCNICSGGIEVPDDFSEAEVVCPNCGREVAVPHLEQESGTGGEAVEDQLDAPDVPPHATTPEEFRAEMEAKRTRGKMIFGLSLAAVLLGLVALFLFVFPKSSLLEFASDFSEKKSLKKLYAQVGMAPLGLYQAEVVPGLRGRTEGGAGWSLEEDDENTWLVIEAAASPRFFPPTDEGYKRIVQEAERHKETHPDRVAPPRERCRFFDPQKFQLIAKGVPAVRGQLININYGEYKGFYNAFSYVAPEGSPADAAKAESKKLEDGMLLSIAFVVPASGIDREEVWIQLDGLDPQKVSPVDPRTR